MELKFKFNEQDAVMRSGTIRDRQARRMISQKLAKQCGGYEHIPELEQSIMWEYATILSQTTPLSVPWWRDASEAGERLYEGYVLFAEADGEEYDVLRHVAVELDSAGEKKVKPSP